MTISCPRHRRVSFSWHPAPRTLFYLTVKIIHCNICLIISSLIKRQNEQRKDHRLLVLFPNNLGPAASQSHTADTIFQTEEDAQGENSPFIQWNHSGPIGVTTIVPVLKYHRSKIKTDSHSEGDEPLTCTPSMTENNHPGNSEGKDIPVKSNVQTVDQRRVAILHTLEWSNTVHRQYTQKQRYGTARDCRFLKTGKSILRPWLSLRLWR